MVNIYYDHTDTCNYTHSYTDTLTLMPSDLEMKRTLKCGKNKTNKKTLPSLEPRHRGRSWEKWGQVLVWIQRPKL